MKETCPSCLPVPRRSQPGGGQRRATTWIMDNTIFKLLILKKVSTSYWMSSFAKFCRNLLWFAEIYWALLSWAVPCLLFSWQNNFVICVDCLSYHVKAWNLLRLLSLAPVCNITIGMGRKLGEDLQISIQAGRIWQSIKAIQRLTQSSAKLCSL